MLNWFRRALGYSIPLDPRSGRYMELTEQWYRANQRSKEFGCPCGGPSEVVTYQHTNEGGTPIEVWRCREHVRVRGWKGPEKAMRPTSWWD